MWCGCKGDWFQTCPSGSLDVSGRIWINDNFKYGSLSRHLDITPPEICRQMMHRGESVMESAKRYYMLCHAWLTDFANTEGYADYAAYLDGVWLKNKFMEYQNYDGVVRLVHLINHPGQGFNPWELFRATEMPKSSVARRSDNMDSPGGTASATTELSEWQKGMYWQLYNPVDPVKCNEDITKLDGVSVGIGLLAIEKYDSEYIQQMLKEKLRLLDKKQKGLLSEDESGQLDFIDKVLQDALGGKQSINPKTKMKRGRIFKKPEDNKSYACVKMSINRAVAIFPEGSQERNMINKYFRYENGKFYWEQHAPKDNPETA